MICWLVKLSYQVKSAPNGAGFFYGGAEATDYLVTSQTRERGV